MLNIVYVAVKTDNNTQSLTISCNPDWLAATRGDNFVQALLFDRPTEYADADCVVFASDGQNKYEQHLGSGDEYQIVRGLTRGPFLYIQIGYEYVITDKSRYSNILPFSIRKSIFDVSDKAPPQNRFVTTEADPVTRIRERDGIFQYLSPSENNWKTVQGNSEGSSGGGAYHRSFTADEWEPYLAYYRLTISAAAHQRGMCAAVIEVMRDGGGASDSILQTSRRYPNGNISIFSNLPFNGQVAIV